MFSPEALQLYEGLAVLLMLLALLGLHHWFFRHWPNRRLYFPALGLALLLPAWLACNWLEALAFGATACGISLRFLVIGMLAEMALIPLAPHGRVGAAVALGTRLFLSGLAVLYLAMLVGFPLEDSYARQFLAAGLVVYLALHLTYAAIFKRQQHGISGLLRRRVRAQAYLLVPALTGFYALAFWHFVPITGDVLTDYRVGVLTLFGALLGEGALAVIFDYYYPVVKRSQTAALTRDLARAVLYLGLAGAMYRVVLHHPLAGLVQASAYFSVGIGLALKPTLGNLVAGLVLRLSQPYSLGDYIDVGILAGKVVRITWRSTDVVTLQGDVVSLPNSKLSRVNILNHSRPSRLHAVWHDFPMNDSAPPGQVIAMAMKAALSVEGVQRQPAPEVYLLHLRVDAAIYRLRYYIDDFGHKVDVDRQVGQALWYRISRGDLDYPSSQVSLVRQHQVDLDLASQMTDLLKTVDFLAELEAAELDILRRRARLHRFGVGETICEQGQPGNSFYIIRSGRLRVSAVDSKGETFLSAEMTVGKYFGEMALLTGEPRSASVVALTDTELLRIHKEDLRAVLRSNPRAEEMISTKLAGRQLRTRQALEKAEERRAQSGQEGDEQSLGIEQLSQQLLAKIRNFFSY